MSLDVYLNLPGFSEPSFHSGIFIRRNGATVEVSREEWETLHPGREPMVSDIAMDDGEVYHGKITHNLYAMANEANLYEVLWHPDKLGFTTAGQLVPLLTDGLALLLDQPERFKALNPANGWGSYDGLVRLVREYLAACIAHPEALVTADR